MTDKKLEEALKWFRTANKTDPVWLEQCLGNGARHLNTIIDAAARQSQTRDEIVRETVERCASACEQLSARYSDTFAVVMAESVEDNRARIARMETCEQAASEIRSLAHEQPVKE